MRTGLAPSPDILVAFYRGLATDDRARTIDEIRGWDDDRLELVHDYIQWLFPLPERSQFNPGAPILDERQIRTFRSDDHLRKSLLVSFDRLLKFFGLEREGPSIRKSPGFRRRSGVWLTAGNHNLLRITRILRCLRILGLEEHSRGFFRFLNQLYEEEPAVIGETTLGFWKRAGLGDEGNSSLE